MDRRSGGERFAASDGCNAAAGNLRRHRRRSAEDVARCRGNSQRQARRRRSHDLAPHPSPIFVYVESGTGRWEYKTGASSETRSAGQAIKEPANVVTRIVNSGTSPLVLVIFQVSRPGAPVLVPYVAPVPGRRGLSLLGAPAGRPRLQPTS